jgi:uncharacterized lipoprotein (TIGR02269 family)
MKTMRTWNLLLGVLLAGCAASGPALSEEMAGLDTCHEASAREEADTCLALLCDEEVCGFFRCEDVAGGVATREGADSAPGGVVKTWANPNAVSLYPPGYNPHLRNWGSPLRLPEEQGAVFVIPWGNHHHRHLLPSQKQLIEEANARLNRPHERHHIFPQEFKVWFKRQGIDIHQWTMLIETDLHKRIHRGESGGPWNAAWRQFIRERRGGKQQQVTQEEIWKHAWELCVRFGLMAPLRPYYGRTSLPPPIEF